MTLESKNICMPPIPYDAFDFSSVIDPTKEICERIYEWLPFEHDPKLPLLLIVIGGSRSGKDQIVNGLVSEGVLKRARTATTKPAESHEDEGGYIRMRQKREGESDKEYHESLIQEYDLIEHQEVHGFLYGLPRRSLNEIRENDPSKIPALILEPNGAKTVNDMLSCEFNVMNVGIIPDNWDQLFNRSIKTRSEEVSIKRFYDSITIYEGLRKLANYYIHNSELVGANNVPGANVSVNSLKQLLLLSQEKLTNLDSRTV